MAAVFEVTGYNAVLADYLGSQLTVVTLTQRPFTFLSLNKITLTSLFENIVINFHSTGFDSLFRNTNYFAN